MGVFPIGLSLERITNEMRDAPFRKHVWPKFLYENARKVLTFNDERRASSPTRLVSFFGNQTEGPDRTES